MQVTVKESFRNLKEGDEYNFPLLGIPLVIVGSNGCGKTSLIHAIVGNLKSLQYRAKTTIDMTDRYHHELANKIEVQHHFERIMLYDSVNDNPLHMQNSADASDYIRNGGFYRKRQSNGEGSILDIHGMITSQLDKVIPGKTLIILDEPEKGISLKFIHVLQAMIYKCIAAGAEVLVISHHPFVIASSLVYDFETKKVIPGDMYIKENTNFEVIQQKES